MTKSSATKNLHPNVSPTKRFGKIFCRHYNRYRVPKNCINQNLSSRSSRSKGSYAPAALQKPAFLAGVHVGPHDPLVLGFNLGRSHVGFGGKLGVHSCSYKCKRRETSQQNCPRRLLAHEKLFIYLRPCVSVWYTINLLQVFVRTAQDTQSAQEYAKGSRIRLTPWVRRLGNLHVEA